MIFQLFYSTFTKVLRKKSFVIWYLSLMYFLQVFNFLSILLKFSDFDWFEGTEDIIRLIWWHRYTIDTGKDPKLGSKYIAKMLSN